MSDQHLPAGDQQPWAVRVTVLASPDEIDAITDRIGEAICGSNFHQGPCANPWSMITAPVADLDEPVRSAWLKDLPGARLRRGRERGSFAPPTPPQNRTRSGGGGEAASALMMRRS